MKGETHRSNRIKWEGSRGKHTQNIIALERRRRRVRNGLGDERRVLHPSRNPKHTGRHSESVGWDKEDGKEGNVRGGVFRMWSRARSRDERPVRRAATVATCVCARPFALCRYQLLHVHRNQKEENPNNIITCRLLLACLLFARLAWLGWKSRQGGGGCCCRGECSILFNRTNRLRITTPTPHQSIPTQDFLLQRG